MDGLSARVARCDRALCHLRRLRANVANGSSLLDGRRSRIELREGHPASQYAGAQQPMSACVTAVSRAHPVVRGPRASADHRDPAYPPS